MLSYLFYKKLRELYINLIGLQGNNNKNNNIMMDNYDQTMQESRQLALRMRMGTGTSSLLAPEQAPTHYVDTLERFQKDFAAYDKMKREQ